MKQYFAKYIPQEGEIKFEDLKFGLKVSTPSEYGRGYIANHKHTEDSVMVIYNMEEEGYYKLSELKLVKLCLCSRDFKKGDVVIYIDGGSYEERIVANVGSVHIYFTNGGFALPNLIAKVIGEISPDALSYVKEGDEFDEDSWEVHTEYGGPYVKELINKPQFHEDIKIHIKGPCNHFH